MKQGALIFDERTDRYDIRFDLADIAGTGFAAGCLQQENLQTLRRYAASGWNCSSVIERPGGFDFG